jgi:hypothetical protein
MNGEQLFEVVNKLTGNITPVADASIDAIRTKNIDLYIDLFKKMYQEINHISNTYANSPYSSQKEIGKKCEKCLNNINDDLNEKLI